MTPEVTPSPVRTIIPGFDLGPMTDPRAPNTVGGAKLDVGLLPVTPERPTTPQPVIPEFNIGGGGRGGFSNIRQLPRSGMGALPVDEFMPGSGLGRFPQNMPVGRPRGPRRLPQIMPERRMPQQRPSNRFFGGGLRSIFSRLPNQRVRERMSPRLPRAPLPMPMPERMPRERFPITRQGFAEGEAVDMNMIIAEQGAREGISPAERRVQSIKNFIKESGRIISERDAELFGMGVLSFEDVIRRAESARQTDLANEQRQNAIANQGRTISNMDRNLMQQEQMFFPQSESLDDILADLEKKN